ncbi:unnamed protein product [Polarella glacialis]|uniref:Uncharacterized protein n=1 Tax=Polarella glacialis TaxID=89957 RepID=A0A813KRF7_POLGL|nr:unnamed protein product [Polarella glacialis]
MQALADEEWSVLENSMRFRLRGCSHIQPDSGCGTEAAQGLPGRKVVSRRARAAPLPCFLKCLAAASNASTLMQFCPPGNGRSIAEQPAVSAATRALLEGLAGSPGGPRSLARFCGQGHHLYSTVAGSNDVKNIQSQFRSTSSSLPNACKRILRSDKGVSLAVVHLKGSTRKQEANILQAALDGPCAPSALLIISSSALQGSKVVRRAMSSPLNWDELARATGPGSDHVGYTSRLTWWSLLFRTRPRSSMTRKAEGEPKSGPPNLYCSSGGRLLPIMSAQRHSTAQGCDKCCAGSERDVHRAMVRGSLSTQSKGGSWLCSAEEGEEETSARMLEGGDVSGNCLARIRSSLSCARDEHDLSGIDWIDMRENMRRALVDAREGSGTGFENGLHGQLHRLVFNTEHGGFNLDSGRRAWISNFQSRFARHLIGATGAEKCLVGQISLQLFVLFFVDRRTHGLWKSEEAFTGSDGESQSDGKIHIAEADQELPLCLSKEEDGSSWGRPDVLSTRIRLLQAVRWMQLFDSGWPIFKLLSLLAHNECRRGHRKCQPRCPEEWIVKMMADLEAKVPDLLAVDGGFSDSKLRTLAMQLWSSQGTVWAAARNVCGDLAVALAGASIESGPAVSANVASTKTGAEQWSKLSSHPGPWMVCQSSLGGDGAHLCEGQDYEASTLVWNPTHASQWTFIDVRCMHSMFALLAGARCDLALHPVAPLAYDFLKRCQNSLDVAPAAVVPPIVPPTAALDLPWLTRVISLLLAFCFRFALLVAVPTWPAAAAGPSTEKENKAEKIEPKPEFATETSQVASAGQQACAQEEAKAQSQSTARSQTQLVMTACAMWHIRLGSASEDFRWDINVMLMLNVVQSAKAPSEIGSFFAPSGVCIISTDPGGDRPLEQNLSYLVTTQQTLAANFWSFTYHLNRLYARLHGYRFRRPEISSDELKASLADGLQPPRRVQWSIVRLVQQELEDRSCRYVVWLDSDAYIVSSEPLETVLVQHGLLNSSGSRSAHRLFLFASAVSGGLQTHGSEIGTQRSTSLNISDHFMIIRNTPAARQLVAQWMC